MSVDDSVSWRHRSCALSDEKVPGWKVQRSRKQNMIQLVDEMLEKDLEYDAFSMLYDKELEEYSSYVDGDAQRSSHIKTQVSNLVPDYRKKLDSLKSGLDAVRLIESEGVKNMIKNCKLLSQPAEKELEKCGNSIVLVRKKPAQEKTVEKSTSPSGEITERSQWSTFRSVGAQPSKPGPGKPGPRKPKYTFVEEKKMRSKRKFQTEENWEEETDVEVERRNPFKSAREQLDIDRKKNKHPSPQGAGGGSNGNFNPLKKSLGARPRNGCFTKFVSPMVKDRDNNEGAQQNSSEMETDIDPRLKGIEPKIIELVTNEIMDHGPPVGWDDIAGLEFAKTTIKEIVIWPMQRPELFTGLRGPPKGILLFGPPGTGKTLIGKCIASQSGATFFSISASSLTSKWVGEGEKMVRALFAVASCHQPAVIFIDEIDSLLAQRSDTEHESSRRIKTEFLVQLDGAATASDERILVVGATNRPQEIDEAARRRLSKRLYIPLPGCGARKQIVELLLKKQDCVLPEEAIAEIVSKTDGYSGADMANLCREAALGPIRSLQGLDISAIKKEDVRAIILDDFKTALQRVRPSVSAKDLDLFKDWNRQFGCCDI